MALHHNRIGWIGAGRMGVALSARLLRAGVDLRVWNRTRGKAASLVDRGAHLVEAPAELADCEAVITIVSNSEVFEEVTLGEAGLLTRDGIAPRFLIDSSTVSIEASRRVRAAAEERGCSLLAAPVSGNPKVGMAGRLSVVVSGPEDAYREVSPLLEILGRHVSYVGEGERARLVKICHNLLLGVTAQMLAETTILAQRGGISRAAYLEFINNSVMGSVFSRYKPPAYVHLDYKPTFTSHLLRKDFELGLDAARDLDVSLPVSALTHQMIVQLSTSEFADDDFAALLEQEARAARVELQPEDAMVTDGLEPVDHLGNGAP